MTGGGSPGGPPLYYVTDDAKWSFYWDAHYLTSSLQQHCGMRARVTRHPWYLRGRSIHFGDRYRFAERPIEPLAARNRLFLTWFHGGADDPQLAPLLGHVRANQQHLQGIVTSCRSTYEQLVHAGIDAQRLVTIPLGVDLHCFRPRPADARAELRRRLGIPADAFCVGSFQKDGCGWGDGDRPKWVKGPDVLVDTLKRLARRCSQLMVVLSGPARGYVKRGLRRKGVRFMHQEVKDYRCLPDYYGLLDAYVIPSRCEGGPKGMVEAWACGVPVVSTRMGMPADWMVHEHNGLLAENEDGRALAEHLHRLHGDPVLAAALRQQAFQDVQSLSWESIARQYYQQLYSPLAAPVAA
jgi:glycosyltransferase involved in cell wall biosynthesis